MIDESVVNKTDEYPELANVLWGEVTPESLAMSHRSNELPGLTGKLEVPQWVKFAISDAFHMGRQKGKDEVSAEAQFLTESMADQHSNERQEYMRTIVAAVMELMAPTWKVGSTGTFTVRVPLKEMRTIWDRVELISDVVDETPGKETVTFSLTIK